MQTTSNLPNQGESESGGQPKVKVAPTDKAKSKSVAQTTKTKTALLTSDVALPFYGLENGAFSLRGGGATVLLEMDGFDFENSGPWQISLLNTAFSDAMRAASKIGGVAASGIAFSLSVMQRRLDLTELISATHQAAHRADKTGITAFALNEEEYLKTLAAENPFMQRRYFLAISLDKGAFQAELAQSEEGKLMSNSFEEELWADAVQDESYALSQQGDGDSGSGRVRAKTKAQEKEKKKLSWEQLAENARELMADFSGGGGSARAAFSTAASSGIQLNPVSTQLAFNLRQRAEIFINALSPFGLGCRLLNTQQAAAAVAEMLCLPPVHPARLEQALDHEIRRLEKRLSQAQAQAQPKSHINNTINNDDSGGSSSSEDKALADSSLLTPVGGNEWGTLDVTRFGYVPIEFASRYTRVGLPPRLASKLVQYQDCLNKTKAHPSSTTSTSSFGGGGIGSLKFSSGSGSGDGEFYRMPRPSFLTTLYSTSWPKQITMGALFPLISRADLEMTVTVQFLPIPRKKAQNKLERRRTTLLAEYDTDKSPKRYYERQEQAQAIEELQAQVSTDEGSIFLAGLRVTVRADNQAILTRDTRSVMSTLSGAGINVTPALYNQALALYSALPLARDFLRESPLFGRRTVRNMTGPTAACLFVALVPEQADQGGIFIGRGAYGGITSISTAKLLAPHGVTYGSSGAGKTVSKELEVGRRLTANPNLSVMYIDPQGVLRKTAHELGGLVLDMSAEAEKKVRLNFLDRFGMGGRPQSFNDLSTIFLTSLSLMQKQQLAPNERSSTIGSLKRLVRHYELGESLTPLLIAGLKNRFFDQLHLEEFGRLDVIRETLEAIYSQLRSDYAIPRTGYLVQPVRDRTSGLPRPVFSTPALERTYYRERAKGAGRSDTLAAQDAAIELIVLNTYSEGGRNLYAGEGQLRVQIPLLAYDKIERYVLARKNGGELDRSAWLALSLMRYLADPDQPRRQAPVTATTTITTTTGPELALAGGGGVGAGVGAEWRIPRLHPDSPVSDLATNAGPVWYAEDGWAEELAQDFAVQCGDCGLFNGLNKEETSICMRDLLVELRYGTPILSDLLAVLASEPYGYDLVKNLEIFVDPDVSGPLFNGHTNVNVFNRFIVFDVKNVNDELRPLRMMQCMELSWRLITSNSNTGLNKSYMMLVDEFGVVANQAPEVATYVGLMYKRSRAFGCAMWLMDQEPLSAQTLAGKQAISNSGIIELMRQKRDDLVSYWQPLFQLTPEEVDMISNFGPGEVMIILNEESRIRKVRAKYTMSDSMLKILSTKLDDVRQYISSQQEARGVKGDPLAEMLEELMGHSFEEAS